MVILKEHEIKRNTTSHKNWRKDISMNTLIKVFKAITQTTQVQFKLTICIYYIKNKLEELDFTLVLPTRIMKKLKIKNKMEKL